MEILYRSNRDLCEVCDEGQREQMRRWLGNATNYLTRAGLHSIEAAFEKTDSELLAINGFGPEMLKNVRRVQDLLAQRRAELADG